MALVTFKFALVDTETKKELYIYEETKEVENGETFYLKMEATMNPPENTGKLFHIPVAFL